MKTIEHMDELLEFFISKGKKDQCKFPKNGGTLKDITKGIPDAPGVYIICYPEDEIVYIGKAGTVNQDGTFKKQGLRRRLTNQHHGIRREDYFKTKIEEDGIEHIVIRWYELESGVIPGYVEGLLIQVYFNEYGLLPKWNIDF